MARQITVDLVSDTKDFENAMKSAGAATEKLEQDLKQAEDSAGRFDRAMEKTNSGLDTSTGKFRSTADLAGGLGNVMGIEVLGQAEMFATGIADISDGLGGLLAPALAKSKAAFAAMNATMLANPIFLVIAALTALTVAFVIAYKKSETFREIVNGAFSAVKGAAQSLVSGVASAFNSLAGKIGGLANIMIAPYRIAFDAIRSAWNSTVGGFGVSIPKVFGFGGASFTIPEMAKGGIVTGPTLALIGEAGPEAVVPLNSKNTPGMGGATTVRLELAGADDDMLRRLRKTIRVKGGNVQVVLGGNS